MKIVLCYCSFFSSLELFLCSLGALLFHKAFLNTLYISQALNPLMDLHVHAIFHDFTMFINIGNYHTTIYESAVCVYSLRLQLCTQLLLRHEIAPLNRHIINNI